MKKRMEAIFCVFMAAVMIVISVIFLQSAVSAYSDLDEQKKDLALIESANEILTENKDMINSVTSYTDAMKILEERGVELSFVQKDPAVFYIDAKLRTRNKLSWWFNTFQINYKNSRINFYDDTEEIIYTFYNNDSYRNMRLVSTRLDVGDLTERIGDEKINLSLPSYEFEAVSCLMVNSIFYDGEMYSYSFDGKNFIRREVQDIRDKQYFGYDLVITGDVESIPAGIFDSSYIRRIQTSDKITEIDEEAFKNCAYLEEVRLSENISVIPRKAFSGCISLYEMNFNDGLESIEDEAFAGCAGLSRLYLPVTLKNIEDGAFLNCDNISVINYGGSREEYNALGFSKKFSSHYGRVLRYDDNIYNGGWVYVTTDENATTFETTGYVGLRTESVYINDEYTKNEISYLHTGIKSEAFAYDSFIKLIRIKDGIKKIGEKAFYHTGIEAALIPASVGEIGIGAYSACYNLKSIDVSEDNERYFSYEGVLFEIVGDEAYLLCFPAGYEGDYKVPSSAIKGNKSYVVTGIRKFAFSFASHLNSVSVPASVKIDDGAFDDYFGKVVKC